MLLPVGNHENRFTFHGVECAILLGLIAVVFCINMKVYFIYRIVKILTYVLH